MNSLKLKTLEDIAKFAGFNRKQVGIWWKKEGAPKRRNGFFDPDECISFIQKKAEKESSLVKVSPDLKALKLEELHQKIEKLRIQNDREKGRLMPVEECRAEVASQARAAQNVLNELPARLAPELAGLSVVDIESKLQRAIDEAIACLGNTK